MTKNSFFLQAEDGLTLEGIRWRVEKKDTKAAVFLIHGLGEHTRRYEHLAAELTAGGYAVLGIDLRGHGRSEGKRGHTPSIELLLADIHLLHQHANNIYPGLPLFIFGHSLGGNLALRYLYSNLSRKKPLSGAIISSPLLGLGFEPPAWKIKLAQNVANLLPTLSQPNGLDASKLSRDPEVVKAYLHDPLVHNRITTRMFVEMMRSAEYIKNEKTAPPVEVLLYHGSDDVITSFESSRKFAASFPEQIQFVDLQDFYHEPHNEPGNQRVFDLIKQFLTELLLKSRDLIIEE
jgi:alpha-beta hydrolase superfamily lysophospholipase